MNGPDDTEAPAPQTDEDRDRRAVLRVAAAAMRDRARPFEVAIKVTQGPNVIDAWALFLWPGVVAVKCRHSGDLLAQSVAGSPDSMDEAAVAAEHLRIRGISKRAGVISLSVLLTAPERGQALDIAARRLQDRQRLPLVHVSVPRGVRFPLGTTLDAVAVLHFPGVLRVSSRYTHELLAQSLPGQPLEPDETAT